MAMETTSWFYESANEHSDHSFKQNQSSFATYQDDTNKTFQEHFNDLYEHYRDQDRKSVV